MAGLNLGGNEQTGDTSSSSAGEDSSEDSSEDGKTDTVAFDAEAKNEDGETETLVHVEADADAFPEGTTLEASVVKDPAVIDSITEAIEGDVVAVHAVDLTFTDAKGETVQPGEDSQISVTLSVGETASADAKTDEIASPAPQTQEGKAEDTSSDQSTETTVVQYTDENGTEPVETNDEVTFQVEPDTDLNQDSAVSFDMSEPTGDQNTQTYAIVETVPEKVAEEEIPAVPDGAGTVSAEPVAAEQEVSPLPAEEPAEDLAENTLTARDDSYLVTVTYGPESQIPQHASLQVKEILSQTQTYEKHLEDTQKALSDAVQADTAEEAGVYAGPAAEEPQFFSVSSLFSAPEETGTQEAAPASAPQPEIVYARFFDITILDADGKEFTPREPVKVSIEILDAQQDEAVIQSADTAQVIHFGEEKTEVVKTEVIEDTVAGVTFDAAGFSVYGVVYTVDYHWNVNGQTFDFSIPGGGFVSLYDLVEALGIQVNDPDTEEDEIQKLVDSVESMAFSNPELVWVGRASEAATVGQLKQDNGLDVEYSAELTETQIEELNAQTVKAGDWALISVRPFTSEESLTVTMKNGEVFTVKVTDAQIAASVLAADGERFRITVTYGDDAKIPEGSILTVKEIPQGSEEYENYLSAAGYSWDQEDREGYISFARFFDIEIRKDEEIIEPEAAVQVDIRHEDGLVLSEEESLSVIHFAQEGTEIIDELRRNQDGTEVVYKQDSFSVIGTVSTVKDSGWPTANGQYVLVLQDGDDYYALKKDGTLEKVRYFNNTVSFIGEGTTTTDYINDYLWYVVSSSNRGKISDAYTEYNATPDDQTFIDLYYEDIFSRTSRQLQIRDGKIYCNGQIPGSSSYTQYTLSASGGQLSRVALTSNNASPVFFATANSFIANSNETDLFTQEEVESIIKMWSDQKTQEATYDKTAEVYDYENRVYRVDITASSADYEVSPSIALEFVVDASRSMFFPTSVTEAGTFSGTNASNVRDWINENGNINQVYFVIQDKDGKATQYAIFYDPNSEYQVNEPYWNGWRWVDNYVTYRGQWLWCDASNYNPPDDKANGGTKDSRHEGRPLSTWGDGSMDDGKIYTTDITGSSNGTYGERKTWISRIEYLKQCVRVAAQVIYAVDDRAQIGLIGFNAETKDYGTFGKDEQQDLLNQLDSISLAGGTNHQGGLQKAIDKYKNMSFYAEHYAGRKHVVVLVTDGAPNASGVNWTTIGNVATKLKNLKDDFGNKTELYTMGLSLTNVGSNQGNLFGVSSGTGYTYAGEDAAQIINAVTKMVDGIFVQANLVADVKDVIDPAFYPVNKTDGRPLAEDDWISLNGTKVNAGANDAAGQVKKDTSTGNWYVEWKDQSIDWPTTDSSGGITAPGWHGTVFVKAKEDFLGGNGISTNAEGSLIEATKFTVRGETTPHDLPEGDHTTSFETPYVNVDELDITKNDTEWTVYLGTNVDPLKEVKALWEKVMVKEVVTKTDTDHRISSDGQLTYQYASDTNDNRTEINGREDFSITDLAGMTLTDEDWADLIAGQSKIIEYSAYNHARVGTIMVSLTGEVKDGEKDLSDSPHDTAVVGDEAEKYTLTVSYRPVGANIADWHTGSYGSGMSGSRAGSFAEDNTHIINVYVKGLQITKVDLNDQILFGAKFALYRTARDGETDLLEIDGGQYCKVADLDTSTNGIAVRDQIEQLKADEQYYLVETQTPSGYNTISPIPLSLRITDTYTPQPGTDTQQDKPNSGIYNWVQTVSLLLDEQSGVKRTDAENTKDLTHTGEANSVTEIVYYRITNNPGVSLPSTGGPGTNLIHLLGTLFTGLAGAGLVMKWKRKEA